MCLRAALCETFGADDCVEMACVPSPTSSNSVDTNAIFGTIRGSKRSYSSVVSVLLVHGLVGAHHSSHPLCGSTCRAWLERNPRLTRARSQAHVPFGVVAIHGQSNLAAIQCKYVRRNHAHIPQPRWGSECAVAVSHWLRTEHAPRGQE
jgi:hypothetical protein